MQKSWPESWDQILDVLQAQPSPVSLATVADQLDLAASTVHRHLEEMDRVGLVKKTGHRKEARYEPLPYVAAFWTGPAVGRVRSPRTPWLRIHWAHTAQIDWRFPLVSRLPDREAQQTLVRLLDAAWQRGILTPWLLPMKMSGLADQIPQKRRDETMRRLADPGHHEGTTWVVYGSAARGDARSESDIDLLVILPADHPENQPQPPLKSLIERLVDDINLGATRTLDLVTVTRDGFFDDLPTPLRRAIVRQGMTIYSTVEGGDFIEAVQEEAVREG